ncbi:MAG: DoxX family protein, partial [Cyclobacteriaceae bacterium]
MKKGKLIIYWVATALLSFGMLGSGFAQILHAEDMVNLITHVGYPMYFMYIIGVWKILGVVAILIPD